MSQINDTPVETVVRRVDKERGGWSEYPPKVLKKQFGQHSVLAGRGKWLSGRRTFETGLEERGIYGAEKEG